jgi:hypoxanthine phosphoribosyltransferase
LEEVYELAWDLAGAIRGAGFEPDVVLAVARGGFVPARLVCDFLRLDRLGSLQLRHYAAGARGQEQVELLSPPNVDVEGLRVLVVDDVNDSGETVAAARRILQQASPSELRIAVLHEKERSREAADFVARRPESGQWIVYQWAWVEDTLGFLDRLDPPPTDPEEARERLEREYGLVLGPESWRRIAGMRAG